MKPSLQLKIGQSLAMTPQLQQAIRLLQLSSLELKNEIQEALDSNMMLELDEETDDKNASSEPESTDTGELVLKDSIENNELPDDLPVDTDWDDYYQSNISSGSMSQTLDNNYYDFQGAQAHSLTDHLLWQLNLIPLSDTDKALSETIIDFIDRDGYLTCPLEEILPIIEGLDDVEIEELEAILRLIQSMEPSGVGARDLGECISLQLNQLPESTEWLNESRLIVNNYIDQLASHDYNSLMKKIGVTREQLSEIISLIQSLNPRPGNQIQDTAIQYITPDIFIKKLNDRWVVELNTDVTPKLRVNSVYANMIKRADNSPDNSSLKEHLQEARWLIKSLQSRSETLLKVSACIVEKQQPFLELGEEAMKPMVLHDIANELEMHESTISRVTTNKYMHTPRGIFELKYFFSSHVGDNGDGATSSTAIRAFIKKIIAEENPQKPLSDNKITSMLATKEIKVARRTIAKYREALSIPPSNERKKLT
jgi:RNA polymerase sigma-54 factor